jgi:hypothetical protein
MKSLLLATAAFAASALLPGTEAGAAPISRCSAANGSVIYTDKACGSVGATAVPMSMELIRSLAREDIDNVANGDGPLTPTEEQESAKAYLAARHGGAGCARTPQQLQLLLRGAVSMGDVNRIASAYDWAGMGSAQAKHVLQKLESLGRSPVVSTQYFNATIGDAAIIGSLQPTMQVASLHSGSGNAGFLQLVQSGGNQVTEFEVSKRMGCYFVSF